MEDLLKKINAIALVNEEIIARIRAKKEVQTYSYAITTDTSADKKKLVVKCEQVVCKTPAASIVATFKPACKFAEIPDIFNDKISYTCSSFDDLARINQQMLPVARKFDLFGNSDKAVKELEKYKINFELVQTQLGRIEEQLIDAKSIVAEVQRQVDVVNAALVALASLPAVTFGATRSALCDDRQWNEVIRIVGKTPSVMFASSAKADAGFCEGFRQQVANRRVLLLVKTHA